MESEIMVGIQELVVILLIVVLVFGAKRIPEIMDSMGKGIKTFKKALEEEDVRHTGHISDTASSSQTPSGRVTDGEDVLHGNNARK
jgi:sec-independent protein translocase protein TatA